MILSDFSHLFNRGVHANKDKILENPSYNVHITLSMLLNVAEQFGASKSNPLVIAVDSKPTWRKAYYEEHTKKFSEYKETKGDGNTWRSYKGHRVKDPTIPWDEIYKMNEDILECLTRHSDFFVVSVPECEADDIIAVLARDCKKRSESCWIVANDKDFKQLQDLPLITIYDPIKQLFIPELNTEDFKKLHCITGDTSDNILPIKPRHGEKSKSADRLLTVLAETLAGEPDARARYEFNKVMIDFEYIPEYLQQNILDRWNVQEHSYDGGALMKLFRKYKLVNIQERVRQFKLSEDEKSTPFNQYHVKQEELTKYADNTLERFFGDD